MYFLLTVVVPSLLSPIYCLKGLRSFVCKKKILKQLIEKMNKSSFTIKQRQISYDIIRFVAILIVFSIHCMAGLDAQRNTGTNIFVSNLFHAFQGIGAPLFVLLSGALLLGRLDSPVYFLKKRITRVLVPFVMWSILLYGIYYFVDSTHYGFDLRITPPL